MAPFVPYRFSVVYPFVFIIFFSLFSPATGSPLQRQHNVYFANTEHELHVFKVFGKKPGKTIMLIGGIQGDEPGGYLTADLYADINLKQGNLIVVPRANFYSILLNQRDGLTGDMNRKFGQKTAAEKNMEQEIVSILKKLIGQADCLINLHEGSGYYSPVWKNEMENPQRFGQSIIFDAATYFGEKKQKLIKLEEIAQRVLKKVNPQIENKRYHFRANNHNTVSEETIHREQRLSATYYALTQANIPAFGVETSKFIKNNEEKVALHKLVVNTFMEEFGIFPETPGVHVGKTELNYVLVKINDGHPYAVKNESSLQVEQGAEVIITDIIANIDRGLAADFVGMGSYNDTNIPFRIALPTKVIIRKDAETCGWIQLTVKTDRGNINTLTPSEGTGNSQNREPPTSELRAEEVIINVNGTLLLVKEGEVLHIPRDKPVIIKAVRSNISRLDNMIFANLKGFAPPKSINDGNDINYPIFPDQDLWVRYSENRKGIRYPIKATYKNKVIGTFWLHLDQPSSRNN